MSDHLEEDDQLVKTETKSHSESKELRLRIQANEKESRDDVREEAHFNADKFGHWDEYATKRFEGSPKYQFDMVKPVIDSIAGEIEQMEFGGSVIPTGTAGNEDIATTYEKMLRTISNMSDAVDIYQDAGRNIVDHGYDAVMLITDWADVDSFDQDILIEKIPNAIDRVWLDGVASATKPSDIKNGFVDTLLSIEDYEEQFPKGAKASLSEVREHHHYDQNKKAGIIVSDYYFLKHKKVTLHLLSDNRVVSDEDFKGVEKDLERKNIVITRSKDRMIPTCYMRKLDNYGWLTDEKETPFSYIPVVEFYGNYRVLENRALYSGETRKLMDAQRIYDYGVSRDVNDGALGRKDKIARTTEQGEGHEDQNRKLNTADNPEYLYNFDAGNPAPPPYIIPGAQVDPNLQLTTQRAQTDIERISMTHQPQQGQGIAGHSGKAYEILNEKSDTGSFKYTKEIKKKVGWINQIAIDAIPKVYDTKNRQVRLTNEDGTSTFQAVNEQVTETIDGKIEIKTVNDLAQGAYMFKVVAGPAFTSRRAEGVAAIKEWAALDPTILEEGKDIIYKSLNAPGVSDIAARVRKRMIAEGRIPEDQLTDDERDKIANEIQQQNEAEANQQPDPLQEATVQAILAQVQDAASLVEERQVKTQLAIEEQDRKNVEQQRKNEETLAKIEQAASINEANIQKVQSETLENLKDATGADAILNENVAVAYDEIAEDMAG